jgi:hypothetical protein
LRLTALPGLTAALPSGLTLSMSLFPTDTSRGLSGGATATSPGVAMEVGSSGLSGGIACTACANSAVFTPLLPGAWNGMATLASGTIPLAQQPISFTVADYTRKTLRANDSLSSWVMMGLGTSAATAGSYLGTATDAFRWVDDGSDNKIYSRYATVGAATTLAPGEGFWAYVQDSLPLVFTPADSSPSAVSIALQRGDLGWNQVSNPFNHPVPVTEFGSGTVYGWNRLAADYEERTDFVSPHEAVWIRATNSALTLRPAPWFPTVGSVAPPALAKQGFTNSATLALVLRAGRWQDANNQLGVGASETQEGELPQRFGEGVTLSLDRAGSLLSKDIRTGSSGVERWTLRLSSQASGISQGDLQLSGLEQLRRQGWSLFLIEGEQLKPIASDLTLPVALPRTGTTLELAAARDEASLRNTLAGWQVNAGPFPVRTEALFQFTASASDERVELTLRDVKGNLLSHQVAEGAGGVLRWQVPAGTPSGLLFWELRSGDHMASGRLPLMR